MFSARSALISLALFLFFVAFPKTTLAQSAQQNSYPAPVVNNDVPINQHTHVQSVMIEVMAAAICQLAGVDVINPQQGCLGIDPTTQKIGYISPADIENSPKIGGAVGMMTGLISSTYYIPISGSEYVRYMASKFGVTQPALAQTNGFNSLEPVRNLWIKTRNLAYLFFVIAFVFIGLGIMLRFKIDPRTVMTIQNQIPKMVIGILLITFSYAIAGAMIDLMWLGTYTSINVLTEDLPRVNKVGTENLLNHPIAYFQDLFSETGLSNLSDVEGKIPEEIEGISPIGASVPKLGMLAMSKNIAVGVNDMLAEIILSAVGLDTDFDSCNSAGDFLKFWSWGKTVKDCAELVVFNVFKWLIALVLILILLITIIISLLRIWYMLIKSYVLIMFYVILAPIIIFIGLLPGASIGFGSWFRALFANLAVFPATVAMLIVARIVADSGELNNPSSNAFSPPLLNNPAIDNFGWIFAFGVLLLAPSTLTMIRDALKSPPSKYTGQLKQGLAQGAALPAAVGGGAYGELFRRNQAGQAVGPGALWVRNRIWNPIRARFP
jgi:hypothetical protein